MSIRDLLSLHGVINVIASGVALVFVLWVFCVGTVVVFGALS